MFIVLEGIDGTGKTTTAKMLAECFSNSIVTRTPNFIRDLLLTTELDTETSALYFMADMMQVEKEIIRPALREKKMVICDRWVLSTKIYQQSRTDNSILREINLEDLFLQPDYTFILDLPVDKAMRRIKNPDVFEQKDKIVWEKRRIDYISSNKKLINVENLRPDEVVTHITRSITDDCNFVQG